jgi:glutathione synthase/RimK-type ligase-like ATP-grasp enzyme
VPSSPTDVLLVTFALLPDGEPGGELLVSALAEHGVRARWVVWDDPDVDWAAGRLVAVRSAWDYHRRCSEFLTWARATAAVTPMLNGPDVFAWNADKSYLQELGEHVPVVPTMLLDDATLVGGLREAVARWRTVVIKPRTGAGGVGLVVAQSTDDHRLEGLTAAPWVAQPLVESVRTSGESSVYVLGGVAHSQVDKAPAGQEIRVHELYGGSSRPVPLDQELGALAEETVRAAAGLLDADLSYARVDLLRWQDGWVVSELELIEPGLYLDVAPGNARPFADLVLRHL